MTAFFLSKKKISKKKANDRINNAWERIALEPYTHTPGFLFKV